MTDKLTVLVTGATGRQGGAVATALLAKGHTVRGMTRNPYGEAAYDIKALGVEPVGGDFDEPSTLRAACKGVDAVFAMSTPHGHGAEVEVGHGTNLAEAAKAERVKHFVYTSVANAGQETGVPHFDSKLEVERAIEALDMPFTFIRPVSFMDALFSPHVLEGLGRGTLATALPADRALQLIAVRDIGHFAAHVIEQGAPFFGKAIDIAGDEVSGREQARILSEISGRAINYEQIPADALRQQSPDVATMYEWFDRVGYSVSIKELRRRYPEVGWHSFEAWAKLQDWSVLD